MRFNNALVWRSANTLKHSDNAQQGNGGGQSKIAVTEDVAHFIGKKKGGYLWKRSFQARTGTAGIHGRKPRRACDQRVWNGKIARVHFVLSSRF